MTPHPKRKHSKGRRDRRRAHDALTQLNTVTCSNCGSKRLPHTVCSNCGFYNGREADAALTVYKWYYRNELTNVYETSNKIQ